VACGLRPAAALRPPSGGGCGGGLRRRPAAAACGATPPAVPPCGAALRRRPASKVSARSAQNLSSLRPHAAAFEVRLEHDHLAIVEENSRECCRPWCPSTARLPCPSTARSPSPRKLERPLLRFVADAPHDLSTITLPSSKRTRENAAVLGALPPLVYRVLPQLVHRLRENSNDRCCVSSLTLLSMT